MKRKIYKTIIGLFIFIMCFNVFSYGVHSTGLSLDLGSYDYVPGGRTGNGNNSATTAAEKLREKFGYEGNDMESQMKFKTKVTAKKSGNKYKVLVGEKGKEKDVGTFSEDELKNIFGFSQDDINQIGTSEKSIDSVIIVSSEKKKVTSEENGISYTYKITATEIYAGTEEDYNEGLNRLVEGESQGEGVITHQTGLSKTLDFAKSFLDNPAGTLFTVLFDGLLRVIDVIQMAANFFETIPLKTSADYTVVYEFNYLKNDASNVDAGAGHRNMYTEVSAGYVKNGKSSWQTQNPVNVDIKDANTDETEYGFSGSTLIPVIPVDVFTIAKGNIAIFDPNFLTIDTSIHTDPDSIWLILRKIVTMVIRGLIFITAGILVAGLIWHAINLIWGVITPNQRRDHMQGIHTFVTSLLLLIGTIIIIALGIYINKMFSSYNNINQGTVELPIRVNVQEAGYSFSTTKTGVVRYLAQMQNPNLIGRKIMYTIEYLALALINLISALFFLVRMILMMLGAGYGIVVVAARVIGQENLLPLDYQHWLIWYLALAICQTLFVLAYTIANLIS